MTQEAQTYKFRHLYDRQLQYLADQDIDGMLAAHYNDDASLLNFESYAVGKDQLREFFRNYLAGLGHVKVLSTDQYAEGDDSISFQATVETQHGIARVYDVFVLRDGKIWRHFGGVISFTPNAPANS